MYYYDNETDENLDIEKRNLDINDYNYLIKLYSNSIDPKCDIPLYLEQNIDIRNNNIVKSSILVHNGNFNSIYSNFETKNNKSEIGIGVSSFYIKEFYYKSVKIDNTGFNKENYYKLIQKLIKKYKYPVDSKALYNILLPSLYELSIIEQYDKYYFKRFAFERYRKMVDGLTLPLREKTYTKERKL